MNETTLVLSHALDIAVDIFQAADMCVEEDKLLCRHPGDCNKCMRGFLISKAKKELKGESRR